MLLAGICLVAAGLRFWQLGDLPPGLYRDEAYNGLDASGILNGEHALFFEANNGREPAYIYISSIFIALFGQTPLAIRLAAALIGTLTTLAVYALAKNWFGTLTGLFAAWLWAVTVWPIHLSRLGLRVILAVPVTVLAVWLGTLAWRKQDQASGRWLWFAAGGCIGLGSYTYLTARLFPAVVVVILIAVVVLQKKLPWRGLAWGLAGWLVMMTPLFILWYLQPQILSGRTGQVSILNPDINQGDLIGTFFKNVWGALRLFFIEGDSIVRHNPPGRPLFDALMAVPFVIGLVLLAQRWRKPAVVATACWVAIMLAATILAEDSPHFLRASGILPAALFPAAVGLAWGWNQDRAPFIGRLAVVLIIIGSFGLTIKDYFIDYPAYPETDYLFEAAARDLAENINAEPAERLILVDQRYQDNWPSLAYLVSEDRELIRLDHRNLIPNWFTGPFAFYVWPLDGLDLEQMSVGVQQQTKQPILISTTFGPETRGDLETATYPLYIRFLVTPITASSDLLATFGTADQTLYQLHTAAMSQVEGEIIVDLHWSSSQQQDTRNEIAFVHILDRQSGQVVAQSDGVPGFGFWPVRLWQPNMLIHDQHLIDFNEKWDETRFQMLIGMYPADNPQNRLTVTHSNGQTGGNTVEIR